ncbi:MAG: ligand-binding protein SH3, partial [Candidatus Eisenbacteria bacterium]|nr:ligand-binding protein SH3 [Candidatus Eisenbacteria bacterium]
MLHDLLHALGGLPHELVAFVISALPIAELRGGIPYATRMG